MRIAYAGPTTRVRTFCLLRCDNTILQGITCTIHWVTFLPMQHVQSCLSTLKRDMCCSYRVLRSLFGRYLHKHNSLTIYLGIGHVQQASAFYNITRATILTCRTGKISHGGIFTIQCCHCRQVKRYELHRVWNGMRNVGFARFTNFIRRCYYCCVKKLCEQLCVQI